jgi:hypothetical protein
MYPTRYTREGAYLYGVVRNEAPGTRSINCLRRQSGYFRPSNGWEISPEDANAIEATKKNGWGTHVVVYNNGCGRGTNTYSHGRRWSCNLLTSYNGYYNVRTCALDILLRKYDPLPPTPYPIANPTAAPIAHPTLQPTLEPTKQPTFEPSAAPSLEPTVKPSFAPTEEPIANPTMQPTEEPVANPTEAPTEAPVADPTLEPTMEPTMEPTAEVTVEESAIEVEGDNFCSFTFEKGTTSEDVPAGCALISSKDIGFLSSGDRAKAMFGCAKEGTDFKVDNAELESVGIDGQVSFILPGATTTVKFFEDDNYSGRSAIFNSKYHPAIVNTVFAYEGDHGHADNTNDNVKSLIVSSSTLKYAALPAACHDEGLTPKPTEVPMEV